MRPGDADASDVARSERRWIVCQLGAREHYVLARGLHATGRLEALITDVWSAPGTLATRLPGRLGRRLSDRYSAGLSNARVEHFSADAIAFEVLQQLRGADAKGWQAILRRNHWFQDRVLARLRRRDLLRHKPVVFAYSYAALDILRAARAAGCETVLGQIDPGIAEEHVVADAVARHAALTPQWDRAPERYWGLWREECSVADRILVNSAWSRDGLVEAGIDVGKVAIVPLAFDGATPPPPRSYPARFDAARPLRVLFLGSLVVRKGVAELIDAIRLLRDAPVEFHLVGPEGICFPPDIRADPHVVRHGPAARGDVAAHYAQADLFLLPTLSDGFALTQIEALAHGVPVIASRNCGDVVRDGVDGFLLDAVTGVAIADTVRRYLNEPALLAAQARGTSSAVARFAPRSIIDALSEDVA